ncbi:MAG: lytic transglycosylase domain-containing protein [Pseudomonadota bacterium]
MIGKIRKKSVRTCCFAIILAGICTTVAHADIYRYVDNEGVMHFTNVPVTSQYRVYIKTGRSRSYSKYSTTMYDSFIDQAAKSYNLPFRLLKALIKVESNFNPRAISNKGARGLAQIMPGTGRDMGLLDPFDPKGNIFAGAKYLKRLLNKFNDLKLALAAYNAGPETVDQYNGIPPYQETQLYVQRVMDYYKTY